MATLLILGLLAREVFSFWTGHPFDFELWVRLGYAMVCGGDPYRPLAPVSGLSFANVYSSQDSATIAYLPFWPLFTGLLYIVYSAVGFGNRFAYYFLLKQPVIAGDTILAYLLYSYISSRTPGHRASLWAVRSWVLSPFTIIISSVWGMFDSISMCFILASIMTSDYLKRSLWTGVGIFAKSLALIYAFPATIRKTRNSWGVFIAVALPAFTSVLTLVVMRWSVSSAEATLASTVVTVGGSMSFWDVLFYMNYLGILQPLPMNLAILLGMVWIPAIIAFTILAFRKLCFQTDQGLVQSMLVVTLAFLIFKARVTEQYAIYLLALTVIDVALWNPQRKRVLIATMATALFYLFVNNYFLVRFLSPVYPGYTEFELGLSQIEPIRLALVFASGTAFTCLNILYLFSIMKGNWRTPISAKKPFAGSKDRNLETRSVRQFLGLLRMKPCARANRDRLIRSRLETRDHTTHSLARVVMCSHGRYQRTRR
jgi:hypothetical protein